MSHILSGSEFYKACFLFICDDWIIPNDFCLAIYVIGVFGLL